MFELATSGATIPQRGCKSRIFRRISLLRIAVHCTVLRSRWCQSGVKGMCSEGKTRRKFGNAVHTSCTVRRTR